MKQGTETVWFRRADGLEFEVNVGSAAFDAMTADASFARIEGLAVSTEPVTEEKPKGKGKKAEEKAE